MFKFQEKSPFESVVEYYTKFIKNFPKNSKLKNQIKKQYKIKGQTISLTEEQVFYLRPIAETLAMLDGNAFFGIGNEKKEWWEQYLKDAAIIWESNGGKEGWPSKSLIGSLVNHENDQVRDAFENWLMVKRLAQSK